MTKAQRAALAVELITKISTASDDQLEAWAKIILNTSTNTTPKNVSVEKLDYDPHI